METYNKNEFISLVNEILKNAGFDRIDILLLENQDAKAWYEKEYTRNFENITENTKYGISVDGMIEYDFKSGKIESLLKSFLTKYASRKTAYRKGDDGYMATVSIKNEVIEKIVEKNKDRVYSGLFYTTLYGIGFWCIFAMKKDIETGGQLKNFLLQKKIDFKNEFSDAGWVFRFKINKKVELHNELLYEFKKQVC